jgi:2,3-bisphosphoglycerate-independent phosphoglycerate mutase
MQPTALIIMDGLAVGKDYEGNAVLRAKTPTLDRLWTRADKKMLLGACGPDVGLPQGVPGNSEVGHLNLGAGTIVYQMISTINDAIIDKSFFSNEVLIRLVKGAKDSGKSLHIMGLLSASGVHADIRHLFALLELCSQMGVEPIIHVITDGRDTPRYEAKFYYSKLYERLKRYGYSKIASLSGRFWAMDRNNKWDRIEKAYKAIIGVDGLRETDFETALQNAYNRGEDDETLTPTILVDNEGVPIGPIKDGDYVIFYNFREDRARQITKAFVLPDDKFTHFQRSFTITKFATMSGYEEGLPVDVVFNPQDVYSPLSDLLAQAGLRQFHIAETEKYPHVTYFFNGGREATAVGEEYGTIESPNVFDYSEVPEMSAYRITERLVQRIMERRDDFFLLNIANPDMVGHSGKLLQAIQAVEVTDRCLYFILKALFSVGGRAIIVSDHGNCDIMINPLTGEPDKNHTLNLVPFMYIENPYILDDGKWTDNLNFQRLAFDPLTMEKSGILADVAVSVLGLLGVPPAATMAGQDLLH